MFSSSCVSGTRKNRVLSRHLCNRLGEFPCVPLIRQFVYNVMSTQKTLFDIFQPSTAKSSQTSHLRGRKQSLMKILRRFRDPRNVFVLPNSLKNLHTCGFKSTNQRLASCGGFERRENRSGLPREAKS